jgi:hypothetical protein
MNTRRRHVRDCFGGEAALIHYFLGMNSGLYIDVARPDVVNIIPFPSRCPAVSVNFGNQHGAAEQAANWKSVGSVEGCVARGRSTAPVRRRKYEVSVRPDLDPSGLPNWDAHSEPWRPLWRWEVRPAAGSASSNEITGSARAH